ncbi:17-beta-hydroxysteroid dehydrogenase type 6-like [Penaeus japonicus]|uniref:17-beta-hydroxysteroid dehydrogenase type 6-like n=1 Tax=Penaeus japonicus TaxID=27405 RepID=UPI001C711D64|nr:17-beta-hydroxysteroid dehydrogenase type 6-like [Penaeus japonicus]
MSVLRVKSNQMARLRIANCTRHDGSVDTDAMSTAGLRRQLWGGWAISGVCSPVTDTKQVPQGVVCTCSRAQAVGIMWSWAVWGSLLLTIAASLATRRKMRPNREVQAGGRVVVITGCDSGIGYALALQARAWGFTVIATCLSTLSAPAQQLQDAGVIVVHLDLRRMEGVGYLKKTIARLHEEHKELWCLVNNAGVLTYAHCEWQTPSMMASQILVNLTGAILLTRDLLPVLRRNKGRVVNVSSPSGQLASPFMSVYCGSKWGLEGYSQALRREVAPFGVSVVVVRPCNLPNRTGILVGNADQLLHMMAEAAPETREDYGPMIERMQKTFQQCFEGVAEVQDLRDNYLMQCFRYAMTLDRPEAVYSAAPLVVRFALSLFQVIPTSWLDAIVSRDLHNTVLSLASNK